VPTGLEVVEVDGELDFEGILLGAHVRIGEQALPEIGRISHW